MPRLGGALVNEIVAPLQNAHHNAFKSVTNAWERYIWLVNVEKERDDLLSKIGTLETENSQLLEYSHENKRLSQLLAFGERTGHVGVAANVIGRDPSNWVRAITIDRGTNHGITPGLAVVDGNAVVGQTTAVSSDSARVLLITDSRSSVDAIVQISRGSGIVEGTSLKELVLRYLVKEYPALPGDRVLTSGLDGVYPKGALIGMVVDVKADVNSLFQDVRLLPSVDFNRLENVLVITAVAKSEPSAQAHSNNLGVVSVGEAKEQ
ncbi:MAG: rod shape-determining protein MreC [Deltaproteobacteria bacterium]|nr:rod shape-determining protein MreC [Deltaproteobacteria bacterium]